MKCWEDDLEAFLVAVILPPGGWATEVTLADIDAFLHAQLDVALSTRASEVTVAAIKTATESIDTTLDVDLSTRASEVTLSIIAVGLAAALDVPLSTRASQVTVAAILAQLDVALSTRLAEATFTARTPAALVGGRFDTNTGSWLGSTAPTVGQKTMANSVPVVIASDQTAPVSTTGTHTNVASSATNVTLLAANAARRGATVYNDSTKDLYLKCAATASTTSFTVIIGNGGFFPIPFGYTGIVDGLWSSASGSARIVEFT